MPLTSLVCPECSATLRLNAAIAPGKKIRCPKCQAAFAPTAIRKRDEEEQSRPKVSRKARPEEEPEEPVRRRKKRTRASSSKTPLLLALGGLFACAGVALLVIFLNTNKKPPDQPDRPDRQTRRPDNSDRPKPKEEQQPEPQVTPPKNVADIKKASVFVKVESGRLSGSGSGFIIKVEGQTGYIATNCHVVVPDPETFSLRKPPRVTVTLDSGTAEARSAPAEILALDPERDLAVLRINGVSNLPLPIDPAGREQLRETLPVLICGFPFGERLAAGGSNPEITIASSSITSLRLDAAGQLEVVQVGAGVNPGNSGGPVVDRDGRLVGITVAALRGGDLGFAIPPRELSLMLQGRTLDPGVMVVKGRTGLEFVAVVPLVDPLGKIRSVSLHLANASAVGPGTKPGVNGEWSLIPGARRIDLEIVEGKVAMKRLDLKPSRGSKDALQVSFTTSEGKTIFTEPVVFGLAGAPVALRDPTQSPPPVVPPGGINMTIVNKFPERFEGHTITIRGNMEAGPASRGEEYELQVTDEGNVKPQKLHFAITRDMALELSGEMKPGVSYTVQLTGKIEKKMILGRTVFQVARIELLDGTGRVAQTIPTVLATLPDKPDLKVLNRFVKRYTGKTLTFGAQLFISGVEIRGGKLNLQVMDDYGRKPSSMHFAITPELVKKMPKEWPGGKEDMVKVRLTGDLLAEETDGRQIFQVKRIEYLDKAGKTTVVAE